MRSPTLALIAVLAACGGGDHGPTGTNTDTLHSGIQPPPNGRAEFTVLPVALTGTIEPLGHLSPPGHTIPTDHVYFYGWNAYTGGGPGQDTVKRTVYAPTSGTVEFMLQPVGTDWKISFRVTKDFSYYLDHVLLKPGGFKVGDIVSAGDVIGIVNAPAALDLGAFDTSLPPLPGFANPKRYVPQTLYAVNPFKYFVEPLRSQLYAMQYRAPNAPRDPRIDMDISGRLVGNWYEESVPNTSDGSSGPIGWPKTLAFVYDNYDPTLPRIAIGGTISDVFTGTIPDNAPRFENVSVASGKVTYSVRYTMSTQFQWGLMIVQMLADDRIRVQVFQDASSSSGEFDSRAHIYLR